MYSLTILIGNLGRDPEVRFMDDGTAVAKFSLATSEKWRSKDGEKKERTEWHNVVVWGKQAEHCGQYLAKGARVLVEGVIQSRKYTGRDGADKVAYEIKANRVVFLATRSGSQSTQQADDPGAPPLDVDGDDIPF